MAKRSVSILVFSVISVKNKTRRFPKEKGKTGAAGTRCAPWKQGEEKRNLL